jgi:hypothetical protein
MRPLSKDLREFIHLLNREAVEYLIVGAWAVGFHARPRYTGDVDVFVRRDEANAAKLMRVIEAFGFGDTGIAREDFLKSDFVVQLGVEPNRIDLLTGISGVEFAQAWEHRVIGRLSGLEVNFISRELLLQNKRAASRDKDWGDVGLLERTRPKPPP